MYSIRKLKHYLVELNASERTTDVIPIFKKLPIKLDPDSPRGIYSHKDLIYIANKDLIEHDTNNYCYNSAICRNTDSTYRMFYRASSNPKGFADKIATCLLSNDLAVIEDSHRYLDLYSNWNEGVKSAKYKIMLHYRFKDGEHVEDPRVVKFKNAWFLFYTDGVSIAVAKLNLDTCDVIYSHYLTTPPGAKHGESDGREKNWIPFVADDKLYVLYSDYPRTIFECIDTGTRTEINISNISDNPPPTWLYGFIRGGTPPCIYDSNHLIWFFHSQKGLQSYVGYTPVYMIGCYLTTNTYPFNIVSINQLPLIIGIPAPASNTIIYQDNVVFPCGAVETEDGWMISMGINDYETAILNVDKHRFMWKKV